MTNNEIIAMIISIVAMIVTIISFQFKKKALLLIMQTIGSALYLVSYIFNGGGIAVILNVIFLIRNFLYILLKSKGKKANYILCGCLCFSYLVSYVLFTIFAHTNLEQSLLNALPIVGSILGTIGFAQAEAKTIRYWKLGDSTSWLVYNAYIGLGALGGILGEVFNISSIIISIVRFRNKKENVNVNQ